MTINIKKLFNYWLSDAEESWSVAESLMEKNKYPEALFFGHLALEKTLKAIVVAKHNAHAPPIHNLLELCKKTDIVLDNRLVAELRLFSGFYMAGRYDEEKMDFRKKCTKKFSEENLKKIKKCYLWLKDEAKKISRLL
ncbi:MAG: HEPN domain-containing protein [Candidatus Magasanikbacteria bacterium]|nr:HEPN domain-containing protein [Candidatus Magasanikbacteria bacterium]